MAQAKTGINGEGYDFFVFSDYDSNPEVHLYEMGRYKCVPDYSYGPVIRPRSIMHYVVSGKGILRMMDREYEVKENSIFYIPAGVQAYYKADSDDPWVYMWLHIGGTLVKDIFKRAEIDSMHPVKQIAYQNGQNHFAEILFDMFDNYDKKYYCMGKMYELIDFMERSYCLNDTPSKETLKLEYVNTAIKYIRLKYSEHISVETIAEICGLNRSYLSRLFHETTGMTINKYIMDHRMNAAAGLLKNTNETIEYIAYAVGYNDLFTFSKAFKKHMGASPSDYRKSLPT